MYLLRILIGSLCCLHLLRLARVITLVLVVRHSIGNRSIKQQQVKFRSLLIIINDSYLSLLIVEEGHAVNLPASPGLACNRFTGTINVKRDDTITMLVILDTRRNEKTLQATFGNKKGRLFV